MRSPRIIFVQNLNEAVVAHLEKNRPVTQDWHKKMSTALHTMNISAVSHFEVNVILKERIHKIKRIVSGTKLDQMKKTKNIHN